MLIKIGTIKREIKEIKTYKYFSFKSGKINNILDGILRKQIWLSSAEELRGVNDTIDLKFELFESNNPVENWYDFFYFYCASYSYNDSYLKKEFCKNDGFFIEVPIFDGDFEKTEIVCYKENGLKTISENIKSKIGKEIEEGEILKTYSNLKLVIDEGFFLKSEKYKKEKEIRGARLKTRGRFFNIIDRKIKIYILKESNRKLKNKLEAICLLTNIPFEEI